MCWHFRLRVVRNDGAIHQLPAVRPADPIPAAERRVLPERPWPAKGECGNAHTSQQHKTHKTEFLEVHYPWHPLHQQTIPVLFERRWKGGVAFRCGAQGAVGCRDFDIPAWMFDRPRCSTMTLQAIPVVDMEALIQLRRLLDYAPCKQVPSVVEGGHRLEVTQGGAHGQTLSKDRAVGALSPTQEDS